MRLGRNSWLLALAVSAISLAAWCSSALGDIPTLGSVRRSASQKPQEREPLGSLGGKLTVSPINLGSGGRLTLISPERWRELGHSLSESLKQVHAQLTTLFGPIPTFSTSVRLIDQETFARNTGAPLWTNALYYRGQIMIPLSLEEDPEIENLDRAVRHEYTHAVINALSNGRCPGWLDEGIAQWIEGTENPALRPALFKWLSRNSPLPLSILQGGFTRLEPEMVPAAYAQSLFSSTVVINTFGFEEIRKYFDALTAGEDRQAAFKSGFGIDLVSFESRLGRTLKKWQGNQHVSEDPHAAH